METYIFRSTTFRNGKSERLCHDDVSVDPAGTEWRHITKGFESPALSTTRIRKMSWWRPRRCCFPELLDGGRSFTNFLCSRNACSRTNFLSSSCFTASWKDVVGFEKDRVDEDERLPILIARTIGVVAVDVSNFVTKCADFGKLVRVLWRNFCVGLSVIDILSHIPVSRPDEQSRQKTWLAENAIPN